MRNLHCGAYPYCYSFDFQERISLKVHQGPPLLFLHIFRLGIYVKELLLLVLVCLLIEFCFYRQCQLHRFEEGAELKKNLKPPKWYKVHFFRNKIF